MPGATAPAIRPRTAASTPWSRGPGSTGSSSPRFSPFNSRTRRRKPGGQLRPPLTEQGAAPSRLSLGALLALLQGERLLQPLLADHLELEPGLGHPVEAGPVFPQQALVDGKSEAWRGKWREHGVPV